MHVSLHLVREACGYQEQAPASDPQPVRYSPGQVITEVGNNGGVDPNQNIVCDILLVRLGPHMNSCQGHGQNLSIAVHPAHIQRLMRDGRHNVVSFPSQTCTGRASAHMTSVTTATQRSSTLRRVRLIRMRRRLPAGPAPQGS